MEEIKKENGVEKVDKTFDKAERIWDRFQKLLLKVVGGIVGISLAIYVAYDQVKDKHNETINGHSVKQTEAIPESATKHEEEYKIIKQTYLIDKYGNRKGDTVYIDYYDDGFIDKYYKSDGKIYYEED